MVPGGYQVRGVAGFGLPCREQASLDATGTDW